MPSLRVVLHYGKPKTLHPNSNGSSITKTGDNIKKYPKSQIKKSKHSPRPTDHRKMLALLSLLDSEEKNRSGTGLNPSDIPRESKNEEKKREKEKVKEIKSRKARVIPDRFPCRRRSRSQ
ncbi:hypothetical protein ACLOJK_011919 [Asimina triloba]